MEKAVAIHSGGWDEIDGGQCGDTTDSQGLSEFCWLTQEIWATQSDISMWVMVKSCALIWFLCMYCNRFLTGFFGIVPVFACLRIKFGWSSFRTKLWNSGFQVSPLKVVFNLQYDSKNINVERSHFRCRAWGCFLLKAWGAANRLLVKLLRSFAQSYPLHIGCCACDWSQRAPHFRWKGRLCWLHFFRLLYKTLETSI